MLYFENRALKREIAELEAEKDAQWQREREIKTELDDLKAKLNEAYAKLNRFKAENKKIKKLVREQTGADLLVNALRELGVVPKPSDDYDAFKQQRNLSNQIAQYQNQRPSQIIQSSGLDSLFGGVLR